MQDGRARFGVLVCGSGIGMAIAANRHPGIRAAVLHDTTEARLTRAHNDANVAAFGARLLGPEVALDALRAFLSTPYEGGRHDRRLAKLRRRRTSHRDHEPMNETTPASSPARFFGASLAEADPDLAATIDRELARQQDGIELIAWRTSSPAPCWKRRARC